LRNWFVSRIPISLHFGYELTITLITGLTKIIPGAPRSKPPIHELDETHIQGHPKMIEWMAVSGEEL